MKIRIRHYLCILLLCCFGTAQAMQALFYQPQLRDMAISEARWDEVLSQVQQRGFDTLVIQWTKFGRAFVNQEEESWLTARLQQAQAKGFKLILGLYLDPDFFQHQKEPLGYLRAYLDQINTENKVLARGWIEKLDPEGIVGWYLSTEIDDANWRTKERLAEARTFVQHSFDTLLPVADRPVYITSFFTGKMSPDAYREMLASLSDTGIKIWVQTGEGTGVLSATERQVYLDGLSPCEGVVEGIVRELFIQIPSDSSPGSFKAGSVSPEMQKTMLAAPATCGTDRIFFSLRYLTGMEDIRDQPGNRAVP